MHHPKLVRVAPLGTAPSTLPPRHVAADIDLPRPRTSFIGRQRELAELLELLQSCRLVTLNGAGGVGKTRLALRAAEELNTEVVFVALAAISDAALVAHVIAQVLQVRQSSSEPLPQLLISALRHRPALLVLDNFEQVSDAAPLVSTLLDGCAELSVLVTSRSMLHLSGEQVFVVPPLQVPCALEALEACDSVRLFIDRARLARADFTLDPHNAAAVAELCRRLNGLPLAIELAAARSNVLTPQTLVAQLDRSLQMLVGGPRDMPPRHQTMRAAIDWSYRLLPPNEQAAFRAMAVFAGGWTIEAANAITGCSAGQADLLNLVSALVDQGLVLVEYQAEGEVRFHMLETVRQYAVERLGEAGEEPDARRHHARHFLDLAESMGAEGLTYGPSIVAGLDRLQLEQDNIRAALRWAIDSPCAEIAGRLAHCLWSAWYTRGQFAEAYRWLEEVLQLPAHQSRTIMRAKLLHAIGAHLNSLGEYQAARERETEALGIAREQGDMSQMSANLFGLGVITERTGERATAWEYYSQALVLYRELGNKQREAMTLYGLSTLAQKDEDYVTMRALATDAVALGRVLDAPYILSRALTALADAAIGQGEPKAAEPLLEEALALGRELNVPFIIGLALQSLGDAGAARGDLAAARVHYAESLDVLRRSANRPRMIELLESLGRLSALQGRAELALQLAGAAAAAREALAIQTPPRTRRLLDAALDRVRRDMGRARAVECWTAGASLGLEDACALAMSESVPTVSTGLSEREQEVARLVAQGLSNPQIAATLVIGRRTVQTHVGHILHKLGLSSRAQIAAWVTEQGRLSRSARSVRQLADGILRGRP